MIVPLFTDVDGNHRLDVKDVLCAFLRAEVEIRVVLEGQADQVADRVLRELRELLGAHLSAQTGAANVAASDATRKLRAMAFFHRGLRVSAAQMTHS
jgi:hypothetical protein